MFVCLWTLGSSTKKLLSPTPKIGLDFIIVNESFINSCLFTTDSSVVFMSKNLNRKGESQKIPPINTTTANNPIWNLKFEIWNELEMFEKLKFLNLDLIKNWKLKIENLPLENIQNINKNNTRMSVKYNVGDR